MPEDRFVRVPAMGRTGGHWVYVERAGPRDAGPPVVLLHGFGASSYAWRAVMPPLAEHRRVLAPDLYGFGYTERPQDLASYTRTGQVGLVLGLLDALDHPTAHLVGHSYGGSLAVTLAARHPERVQSLVLIDAAHPSYPQRRRYRLAAFPPWSFFFIRFLGLRRGFVEKALERTYYDPEMVTPERVTAYRQRLRVEGVARAYRGLTAPQPDPGPEVDVDQVRVPTLALWGAEDSLIPVEDAREITSRMPYATFVELPGVGHAPHEEAPAEVARRILEFLDRGYSTAEDRVERP